VVLPDDLVEGRRPHPHGQRLVGRAPGVGRVLEQVHPPTVPTVGHQDWRGLGGSPGFAASPEGDVAAAAGTASTPASLRCAGGDRAGAAVSGSKPPPLFGKAMTSLIDSVRESSAQIRSHPKAMPPCGGAP
jgi:hypothetical protein